ncbi:hypothetical protein EJ03DRAFT_58393 [Teratosphaeria nubilosa]|uniref:Thiolase-like protein type 1 additional C-terminal domain-containing protein n=1 Tax=Teratosphaeria nubilosa TaxID=161662 RepID=A0A6G1KTH0_9PEZI|nr:hypothetical protein EJ03DRAFT_58393 [Teratosphaeria nubilosa]
MERNTPIIIGVGDVVNQSKKVEHAVEPLHLILQAIEQCLHDTGLPDTVKTRLTTEIDSIDVVKTWTWPYPDLAGLVSRNLHVKPARTFNSEHGGNQPAHLLDEAARRISKGESKVAVVTGAEALASLTACAAAGKLPPPGWTRVDQDIQSVFSPTTRELQPSLGSRHGIGNPIHIYPLYENGFRAHRNQSIRENHVESAKLYGEFAKIAEKNEYAWGHGKRAETEQSIGAVEKRNRMICFPYPLMMNAFNTVNLAAATILTSTEHARELGIPESKWIYALGGAGTSDSNDFWQRPTFWWSPCISRSLDAGLHASGLTNYDIGFYDFYSCFPIVPKLACAHLGISIANPAKPITLLGGLTSFGGAGNNYSMHAITATVRRLRGGDGGVTGLVLANGGWISYQHVVCLSSSPRRDGLPYPDRNPLPQYVSDVQVPQIADKAEGEATIETYTVEFGKDGKPKMGHVVGRLNGDGKRFLANHGDEKTLRELSNWEVEPIGRRGRVCVGEDGRNLFTFDTARGQSARL